MSRSRRRSVVVVPWVTPEAVEEFDGDAVDAGFAGVLDAVGVEVIPDEVAEGGGLSRGLRPRWCHSRRRRGWWWR